MTKVLIIDDEPALRFAVHEALEAHGLDVISAESATEALAMLDDVDVVVSDYMMPDTDGMQLLERIRTAHPSLPVILVTAHGSERLAVRALKQGAYDYLSKPFDNDELFFTIDRAAETRRLRQVERERALEQASGVRIVGRSPALMRVLDTATRVASSLTTRSPVLASVSVPCRMTMPPVPASSCADPANRTASTMRVRSASVISRLSLLSSSKMLTSVSSRRSSESIRRTMLRRLASSPDISS